MTPLHCLDLDLYLRPLRQRSSQGPDSRKYGAWSLRYHVDRLTKQLQAGATACVTISHNR